MTYPGEVGCKVNENFPVDTSPVKASAAQVISSSQSVLDDNIGIVMALIFIVKLWDLHS